MQSKVTLQGNSTTVTLIVLLFPFLFFIYFFPERGVEGYEKSTSPNIGIQSEKSVTTAIQISSYGLPLRLRIPSINLDSFVEHVGVTSLGAMDTPKILEDVAWYQLGPHPGDIGSAVMTGHYGWKNGRVSAFDELSRVKIGDKVFVEDDKGVVISFVVHEVRKYDPQADTTDIFSSSDSLAHLNLITCNGTWNKVEKSYTNRLIVFTDRIIKK